MKIKVLVADDHQLFREGLINLLQTDDGIEVISQAENGEEAAEKAFVRSITLNPNMARPYIEMAAYTKR